jgi:hypothetical protein
MTQKAHAPLKLKRVRSVSSKSKFRLYKTTMQEAAIPTMTTSHATCEDRISQKTTKDRNNNSAENALVCFFLFTRITPPLSMTSVYSTVLHSNHPKGE